MTLLLPLRLSAPTRIPRSPRSSTLRPCAAASAATASRPRSSAASSPPARKRAAPPRRGRRRSQSGAYKVRTSKGAEEFAAGRMRRGGVPLLDIAATPMCLLLDDFRRQAREEEEPERPFFSMFGITDENCARVPCEAYNRERDGPDANAYRRRLDEDAAIAAEAQRLWEETARADAAEWRRRRGGEEGKDGRSEDGGVHNSGGGPRR